VANPKHLRGYFWTQLESLAMDLSVLEHNIGVDTPFVHVGKLSDERVNSFKKLTCKLPPPDAASSCCHEAVADSSSLA
jgi:hypothetical protein